MMDKRQKSKDELYRQFNNLLDRANKLLNDVYKACSNKTKKGEGVVVENRV